MKHISPQPAASVEDYGPIASLANLACLDVIREFARKGTLIREEFRADAACLEQCVRRALEVAISKANDAQADIDDWKSLDDWRELLKRAEKASGALQNLLKFRTPDARSLARLLRQTRYGRAEGHPRASTNGAGGC